jgi:tRNA(Ile)-lysidine synthase
LLGVRLHAVHVDHGWREESREEAQRLQKEVEELGITFHGFRLPPYPGQENLENWSRKKRMECFCEVAQSLGARFVVLGHHADDQIEVVMKRFLEGSSVINLRGMKDVEERDEITLLRPLLSFRRETIVQWLHEEGLSYFQDPTNTDERFLRARMRQTIFPFLRNSFGKEFDSSVYRVSEEVALLDEFVRNEFCERFSLRTQKNCIFAFAKGAKVPPFLVRVLLDEMKNQISFGSIPRSCVVEATESFCQYPSEPKQFEIGKRLLVVEHGFLALFNQKPCSIEERACSEEGCMDQAGFHFSWKKTVFQEAHPFDWTDLFCEKKVCVYLPATPFIVAKGSDRLLRDVPKRVDVVAPTSLRPYIPTFIQQGKVVVDLLRRYTVPLEKGCSCIEMHISPQDAYKRSIRKEEI